MDNEWSVFLACSLQSTVIFHKVISSVLMDYVYIKLSFHLKPAKRKKRLTHNKVGEQLMNRIKLLQSDGVQNETFIEFLCIWNVNITFSPVLQIDTYNTGSPRLIIIYLVTVWITMALKYINLWHVFTLTTTVAWSHNQNSGIGQLPYDNYYDSCIVRESCNHHL